MELLMQCFPRAVRSLLAPGMFKVFLYSVLLTLFSLIAFVMLSTGIFDYFFDGTEYDWLTWVAGAGSFMLAWLLFPGIMPIFVNFFDVRIAGLIEKQDYPAATPLAETPFWPELWHDVRFSLFVITMNILLLPLWIIPIFYIPAFYLMNGYLLGKEFFIMAARRHMSITEAKRLHATRSRAITISGMGLTFLATIPFINLVAPFWGVAVMTHIYHSIKATPASQILPPE